MASFPTLEPFVPIYNNRRNDKKQQEFKDPLISMANYC